MALNKSMNRYSTVRVKLLTILLTISSILSAFSVLPVVSVDASDLNIELYASGIIRIDKSKIEEDITDFPVTIVLNSGNFDFSLVQSSGADVFFTDDKNNLLAFEVDYFDYDNQLAIYHVLHSGTIHADLSITQDIWIRYGDVNGFYHDFSQGYRPEDVWDENYLVVMHMSGVYNSANSSDIFTPTDMVFNTNESLGTVAVFDGSGSQILLGSGVNSNSYTKLVYFNAVNTSSTTNFISAGSDNAFYLSGDKIFSREFNRTGIPISTTSGSWNFAATSYDQTTMKIFGNDLVTTSVVADNTSNSNDVFIGAYTSGNFLFNGALSEVRLSNIARSDAWVKAEYYGLSGQLANPIYTVSFETNGGVALAPITGYAGSGINPITTRPGHIFSGWYTDSALTNQVDDIVIPNTDITFYAKWIEDTEAPIIVNPLSRYNLFIGDALEELKQQLTFTDNLDSAEDLIVTFSGVTYNSALSGLYPVEVTITDIAGNSRTYSFDVEVIEPLIGEFNIKDFGSDNNPTSAYVYRGYFFQVSQTTVVTHLIGAAQTNSTFTVGLYEGVFQSNKYKPTSLLGSITFAGNGGQTSGLLTTPITLNPGTNYIIAQGRLSGTGNHVYINNLRVEDLEKHPLIESGSWSPSESPSKSIRWNVNEGVASTIVNVQHSDLSLQLPMLGFLYESRIFPPNVKTLSPIVSGSNVNLRGELTYPGGVDAFNSLFIETSNVSNKSTTVLNEANPASLTEAGTFGFTIENFSTSLNYYYRAVAINENSRVEGEWLLFSNDSEFTLNFANEDGTIFDSGLVMSGSPITVPEPPTRPGYTFVYWYADSGLVTLFTFGNNMPKEDVTIYAKWAPVPFAITYLVDGGENASSNPVSYDITSGTITLDPATKEGFTFIGWTLNGSFVNQIESGSIGDITLNAVFVSHQLAFVRENVGINNEGLLLSPIASASDSGIVMTTMNGQASSVFIQSQLTNVGQSSPGFSTYFVMDVFKGSSSAPADGFVFIVAQNDSSLGSTGGGLGYQNILNSIGLEFDFWDNGGIDGPPIHISLHKNGTLNSPINGDLNNTSNKQYTVIDNISGYSSLSQGQLFRRYQVWIDYDAITNEFKVYVNAATTLASERPATPTEVYTIDIADVVGPNYFVGFTAATGGSNARFVLQDLIFSNAHLPNSIDRSIEYFEFQTELALPEITLANVAGNIIVTLTSADQNESFFGGFQYRLNNSLIWIDYDTQIVLSASDTDIEVRSYSIYGSSSEIVYTMLGNLPPRRNENIEISLPDAIAGQQYSFVFDSETFIDDDGDLLTMSLIGLPPGLTFDPSTLTLSGIPTVVPNQSIVTYTLTYTATDDRPSSASTTLELTVFYVADITFDSNGGSQVSPSTIVISQSVTAFEPEKPILIGYDFLGWFTDINLDNPFDWNSIMPETGFTLYAKWTPTVYTITYNEVGSRDGLPATYTIESEDITLIRPSRPGLIFGGWSPNGFIPSGSIGDRTFTASWTARNYTLTITAGGRQLSRSTIPFGANTSNIQLGEPPARAGFIAVGWSQDVPNPMPASNVTITAIYEPIPEDELDDKLDEELDDILDEELDEEDEELDEDEELEEEDVDEEVEEPVVEEPETPTTEPETPSTSTPTINSLIPNRNQPRVEIPVVELPPNPDPVVTRVSVNGVDLDVSIIPGQPVGNLPAATLPGYGFKGWMNAITGEMITPETVINNPDYVVLVPLFEKAPTLLDAARNVFQAVVNSPLLNPPKTNDFTERTDNIQATTVFGDAVIDTIAIRGGLVLEVREDGTVTIPLPNERNPIVLDVTGLDAATLEVFYVVTDGMPEYDQTNWQAYSGEPFLTTQPGQNVYMMVKDGNDTHQVSFLRPATFITNTERIPATNLVVEGSSEQLSSLSQTKENSYVSKIEYENTTIDLFVIEPKDDQQLSEVIVRYRANEHNKSMMLNVGAMTWREAVIAPGDSIGVYIRSGDNVDFNVEYRYLNQESIIESFIVSSAATGVSILLPPQPNMVLRAILGVLIATTLVTPLLYKPKA